VVAQCDFLVHQNGSIIHALAGIYVLRETPGVEQLRSSNMLLMNLKCWLPLMYLDATSLSIIDEKFKARFGTACKTHIQLVDNIRGASGKIRQVVSKVQPVF